MLIDPYRFGERDPRFENVSLLLHMDGASGSAVFLDSSPAPKNVEVFGGAQISTTQSQFGGASGSFDGNGDYLQIPGGGSEFSWGTGDFTIEGWFWWSSLDSESAILWGNGIGWTFYMYPSGRLTWGRTSPQSPVNLISAPTALSINQFYHVAVTRSDGMLRIFINGTLDGIVHDANNYGANGGLQIGRSHSSQYFNGYIDELRITKGVARYTANFTPPAAPFPDA